MIKLKKYKDNIIYISISLIILLVCLSDLKNKLLDFNITNNKYCIFLIIIYLFIALYLLLVNKIKNKVMKNIPLLFVILSFTLGICYLFISPLFTGSDESTHFYRSYEISNGIFITKKNNDSIGSSLPKSLYVIYENSGGTSKNIKYSSISNSLSVPLNKNDKELYGTKWSNWYSNTALYAFIQYIPQALGMKIGLVFNANPYILGILGRLFNLLFYITIGYFALKLMPKYKLFYLLILISPNMLQCASTLSADAFTNILFLLFISYVFNIKERKEKINNKDKIILLVLSIFISVCKLVYFPVLALLLLIKNSSFKSKKNALLYKSIVILISLFTSMYWLNKTGYIFDITYFKTSMQKEFVFNNLFEYIIIFIRTYLKYFLTYIEELFIGSRMYHSTLVIPSIISYSYVLLVIVSLLKEKVDKYYKLNERIIIIIISLFMIGLMTSALYLQCTAQFYKVGYYLIEGIQGRYFIPIIFLIPFAFEIKQVKININDNTLINISILFSFIVYIYMFTLFAI